MDTDEHKYDPFAAASFLQHLFLQPLLKFVVVHRGYQRIGAQIQTVDNRGRSTGEAMAQVRPDIVHRTCCHKDGFINYTTGVNTSKSQE